MIISSNKNPLQRLPQTSPRRTTAPFKGITTRDPVVKIRPKDVRSGLTDAQPYKINHIHLSKMTDFFLRNSKHQHE